MRRHRLISSSNYTADLLGQIRHLQIYNFTKARFRSLPSVVKHTLLTQLRLNTVKQIKYYCIFMYPPSVLVQLQCKKTPTKSSSPLLTCVFTIHLVGVWSNVSSVRTFLQAKVITVVRLIHLGYCDGNTAHSRNHEWSTNLSFSTKERTVLVTRGMELLKGNIKWGHD